MRSRKDPRTTEIRYARLDTPLGPILAAAGDRGVRRLVLRERDEAAFARELRARPGVRPRRSAAALKPLHRELRAYFAGRLRRFTVPFDLSGLTPFHQAVLRATAKIRFGRTASYGEIAKRIGKPGASRAVGNALGKNPVSLLVPCHRVVGCGGSIGGFTGGLGLKRALLKIEGLRI